MNKNVINWWREKTETVIKIWIKKRLETWLLPWWDKKSRVRIRQNMQSTLKWLLSQQKLTPKMLNLLIRTKFRLKDMDKFTMIVTKNMVKVTINTNWAMRTTKMQSNNARKLTKWAKKTGSSVTAFFNSKIHTTKSKAWNESEMSW